MGDAHLDTIPTTGSDEFIKSSVENLVPNPSEFEGESECDVPACFTTFSNILFDAEYDFYSSDDQSFSDEDLPKEIYSNPLFDEEICPMEIDPHPFNAESDLIESMLNHDSSIIISSQIDSLFDEFAGELTLFKSIPPRIDEPDCYPEEEIHFTKRLLYDNLSPSPPKEFVYDNFDAEIESFSPYPIPIKDNDSLMEEIDLSFTPECPMPSGIEEDDYDSERDIPILEELLDNYSLSLPDNESFYFDIPLSSRPPAKPPDGNTRILNIKMMVYVSEQKVPMPRLTITRVSNQDKSPDLLSHQGPESFQPFAKCRMMIHGKNIPILDVPLFHFIPLDQLKYGGIRLLPKDFVLKSSFPQLQFWESRMADNTLFTKKKSSNHIIVQIYVDDIIFGSTSQDMCDEFSKIMHDKSEMSMMGELNFFLGLQIKMEESIFFNQSKYIKEMLKKFRLEDSKPIKTPMSSDTKLTKDEECKSVDSTKYQVMIGSLLYLTASRPDIMFSVCLCARFQEAPKTSHLKADKRIFQYIKGTTDLGLRYPKETGIETVVYADSDHAGDYVDRKSTSGICTFVGCCLTS
nr:hypothetical protein [Tanacetum cinerariifolium]